MAELTGKLAYMVGFTAKGNPIVTLELNEKMAALKMVDELHKEKKLSIKIGRFREKRSLDANAYFHLLVNKIASKLNESDDEIKRKMVKSYGTLARDENGELIGAMLPAGANVDKFYPYTRNYKTEYRDGREYNCYLFYERTRDLNTAQMSHLIEGTVQEAQALGIETKSREEIESLLKTWR